MPATGIQSLPLSLWDKKISSGFMPQVRALLPKDNFFRTAKIRAFFCQIRLMKANKFQD